MSWSPHQIAVVERSVFTPTTLGYSRDDVERLRLRALLAMRAGKPLPDLDAMALRRVAQDAVSVAQVDGLLTLLSVWKRTTPVITPKEAARLEREERLAALASASEAAAPRWSHAQMDLVREKTFTLAGRTSTAYDESDVNEFLDSVVDAMRRGIDLPDPAHARFNSSGLRRGYDPREVDEFLDVIARMRPEG